MRPACKLRLAAKYCKLVCGKCSAICVRMQCSLISSDDWAAPSLWDVFKWSLDTSNSAHCRQVVHKGQGPAIHQVKAVGWLRVDAITAWEMYSLAVSASWDQVTKRPEHCMQWQATSFWGAIGLWLVHQHGH